MHTATWIHIKLKRSRLSLTAPPYLENSQRSQNELYLIAPQAQPPQPACQASVYPFTNQFASACCAPLLRIGTATWLR